MTRMITIASLMLYAAGCGSAGMIAEGDESGQDDKLAFSASAGEELCDNQLDDDGDGEVDEGCSCSERGAKQACYTGPAETRGKGPCQDGEQECIGDDEFLHWGPCEGGQAPEMDLCDDGLDQDCNETPDDGPGCWDGGNEGGDPNIGGNGGGDGVVKWGPGGDDDGDGDGSGNGGDGDGDGNGGDGDGDGDGNGGDGDGDGNGGDGDGDGDGTVDDWCGPANCGGCCTLSGRCIQQDVLSNSACGLNGAMCDTCGAQRECNATLGTCQVKAAARYTVILASGVFSNSDCKAWLGERLFEGQCDIRATVQLGTHRGSDVDNSDNTPNWFKAMFTVTEKELLGTDIYMSFKDEDILFDDKLKSCARRITKAQLEAGTATFTNCGKAKSVTLLFQPAS